MLSTSPHSDAWFMSLNIAGERIKKIWVPASINLRPLLFAVRSSIAWCYKYYNSRNDNGLKEWQRPDIQGSQRVECSGVITRAVCQCFIVYSKGLQIFFYKWPENKYFRHRGPYILLELLNPDVVSQRGGGPTLFVNKSVHCCVPVTLFTKTVCRPDFACGPSFAHPWWKRNTCAELECNWRQQICEDGRHSEYIW